MTIRVTMFFETDQYSWSESHYLPGASNIPAALAGGAIPSLGAARANILAAYATLVRIRVSDTNKPRQAVDLFPPVFPSTGQFGVGGNYFTPADRPYSAVMVKYYDTAGNPSFGYVSGVPDNVVGESATPGDGLFTLGQWGVALQSYIGFLALSWAPRSINSWANIGVPPVYTYALPVQGLVTGAQVPSQLGIQTAAQLPGNPQPGQRLAFRGFTKVNPRAAGLTKPYLIGSVVPPVAPATMWTYFLQNSSGINPSNIKTLGLVAQLLYAYNLYASGSPYAATHRKRGSTAEAARGRSRTRS